MRKHIKNNVSWVGKIDWELQEFHGSDYTINNGSSQNAYLIEEEKTVLIDTVWKPHSSEFIDNLESEIDLNTIDFIVCNHGEVDHAVEELWADKADQCRLWEEAMKYYANILNPFSPLVKAKVEEIQKLNLPIDIIATSHGAIWRENPMQIVEKYYEWSQAYQENQITIVYDTMWDGTKKLAHKIAEEIAKQSPDTRVKIFNISKTNKNDIMTEVFKSKAIAVGSPTVGNSVLSSVAGWLDFLRELKFKNKKAAVFGTYGWSGESTKVLREELTKYGFSVVEPEIKCNWNPEESDFNKAEALVSALLA